MKTSIKLAFSLLLLALSVSAPLSGLAQSDQPEQKAFATAIYPSADVSKVWLLLERYKADEKINVELVNERGQVLFRETLPMKSGKRNAYRQPFDLTQISDGKYSFRISAGAQTEEIAFKLSTPNVVEQLPSRLVSMN